MSIRRNERFTAEEFSYAVSFLGIPAQNSESIIAIVGVNSYEQIGYLFPSEAVTTANGVTSAPVPDVVGMQIMSKQSRTLSF